MTHNCLVLNMDKEYVRTSNFVKFTADFFDHTFMEDCLQALEGEKTFRHRMRYLPNKNIIGRQILKLYDFYRLKKEDMLVEFAYIANLDPVLVKLCNINNIKIISDIMEPFPEAYSVNRIHHLYLRNIEKYVTKNSDIVLAVTEEETENLKNRYKLDNIYTIRNFPDRDVFKPTNNKKFDEFSVVYFGIFAQSRDLGLVTKAISKLQKENYNIRFHIIGPKELLSQVHCDHIYHGWLNNETAAKIISRCHVGVAIYMNTLHGNLTLQNKSFQYAACNVIPISTELKPLYKYRDLIELVLDNDVHEWYKKIIKHYTMWKNENLVFNQREILIRNNWVAQVEWEKLRVVLCNQLTKV